MTNNFEHIKSILKFEDDYFYFIQIIQRKKEIPELGANNRIVRSYMISSLEKFEKNEAEIIKMCEMFNARAYIHLNRRKWSRIALECLRHNAELIANGQNDGIKASLETVIGRNNCEPKGEKTWIVDIDEKLPQYVWQVENFINYLEPIVFTNLNIGEMEKKVKSIIPTKNGYHLITSPFNSQVFKQTYPDIDIHKDNPTVLYVP